MANQLIYPQLVGKMIQKIEEDSLNGVLRIHTKAFILEIVSAEVAGGDFSHVLKVREKENREPIVVTGKKSGI